MKQEQISDIMDLLLIIETALVCPFALPFMMKDVNNKKTKVKPKKICKYN